MKYMSVWSIKEANNAAAVERFSQNPPEVPEGVTMLGRWHECGTGKGFALMETDDPVALSRYIMAWADLVDQKITPVVEDEQIGQAMMG